MAYVAGQINALGGKDVVMKAKKGDQKAMARIKELKAQQKQHAEQLAKTKLSRIAKDPKERVRGLNRRRSAKQRAPRILAEFTIEKLLVDMERGGGLKGFKRGERNYTADDLVLLKAHLGGGSGKCRIEELQQQVHKLYKEKEEKEKEEEEEEEEG